VVNLDCRIGQIQFGRVDGPFVLYLLIKVDELLSALAQRDYIVIGLFVFFG
jgi:hypothetical protein